ncbi:hypothetical protein IMZ11_22490 [Microtetraspora sp. AC03309]|uniref:hypothetical protein n=1 Tax=Microtetraspora sp. AC03309 TaxID=2779376 RepID=UPI001E60110B|nr:hypothetical protein [Microtetraspora sp. AC03309]MCC5578402.1 hypothetical protein [Microtetraspora sp. AC03309]
MSVVNLGLMLEDLEELVVCESFSAAFVLEAAADGGAHAAHEHTLVAELVRTVLG